MASTSGEAGSEVRSTSEASSTACAESARRAPPSTRFAIALGFMSKTVIGNPALSTLAAIGLPMLPTPMNPTERAMRASLGDLRDDGGRFERAEHKPPRRAEQRAVDSALVLRAFALDPIGTVSIEEMSSVGLLKLSTRTYWRRVWPAGGGSAGRRGGPPTCAPRTSISTS